MKTPAPYVQQIRPIDNCCDIFLLHLFLFLLIVFIVSITRGTSSLYVYHATTCTITVVEYIELAILHIVYMNPMASGVTISQKQHAREGDLGSIHTKRIEYEHSKLARIRYELEKGVVVTYYKSLGGTFDLAL